MYHPELGKTTFEIWEDEQREFRLVTYRRKKQLENIINGLANLLRKRIMTNEDDVAKEDMIEEGGPVVERDELTLKKPYERALELDRRHRATRMFLGLDPLHGSCDEPLIQSDVPQELSEITAGMEAIK